LLRACIKDVCLFGCFTHRKFKRQRVGRGANVEVVEEVNVVEGSNFALVDVRT
jgi:hypothetical protein